MADGHITMLQGGEMTRMRMITGAARPRSLTAARLKLGVERLPDFFARRLRARHGWRRWR